MLAREQQAIRTGTRAAMKRLAERRRCPKCNRGNAVKRTQLDPWTNVSVCRWCGELPTKPATGGEENDRT